ncbi:MAG: hypothetical protein LBH43_02975 [Treponema sp.]|nr:hypothetical protein [Treponema sp.]
MEKSICPRGGAVILTGKKPLPASYSIYKPAAASRVPTVYGERPSGAAWAELLIPMEYSEKQM